MSKLINTNSDQISHLKTVRTIQWYRVFSVFVLWFTNGFKSAHHFCTTKKRYARDATFACVSEQLTELSLAQLGQSSIITKVYHLHLFLNLPNLNFKVILNYSVLAHSLRDGFLCTQSHLKHVLDERGQLRKKTSVLVYLIHTYTLKMKAT